MKAFISFVTAVSISLSSLAQSTNPTLTVILRGNFNQELIIDGKDYTPRNVTSLNNVTVTITDLAPGQHQFEVTREGSTRSQDLDISTTISLRNDFDKKIIVAANGSLQQQETRKETTTDYNGYNATNTAMADADFQLLYRQVRSNRRTYDKRNALADAFENSGNHFSTAQIGQLLSLMPSERYRLELAKSGYSTVVDPYNYSTLLSLLRSTSDRNELSNYIRSYDVTNNTGNTNVKVAMTSANFNTLYTKIQYETSAYTRSSLISDAFNNNANYFTTDQVSRLLYLITDERTRLDLAKNSYSKVTDPVNFNRLYDLLSTTASRNELADYVRSNAQRSPAMNTTTFNALYRNMQSMYSSARVTSLSGLFNDPSTYFTSLQVRQLLGLINSEAERFELAKAGYSRVVDPNGYAQVVDIFTSTTYRSQLNAYIGNYYGGGVNRTAMSSSDFSTIYRNVQMTFGFGAKYSSLTDIFKNNSYYFTTDQAEQLIRLVSDEDNRLALSKLAYSHLTDPENVSALYDMFQDQYRVSQLKDFISNR